MWQENGLDGAGVYCAMTRTCHMNWPTYCIVRGHKHWIDGRWQTPGHDSRRDDEIEESIRNVMRTHGITQLILADPDGSSAEIVMEVGLDAEPAPSTEAIEAALGAREGIVSESDAVSNSRCPGCGSLPGHGHRPH